MRSGVAVTFALVASCLPVVTVWDRCMPIVIVLIDENGYKKDILLSESRARK